MKLHTQFALAAIAAFALFATPNLASAQSAGQTARQSDLVEVTSTNAGEIVKPKTAGITHAVIAVCDGSTHDCQEFALQVGMSAALSRGGWLNGVAGMHSAEFYQLDTSKNALSIITNSCPTHGVTTAANLCYQLKKVQNKGAMMILVNYKKGSIQVLHGTRSDPQLRNDLVNFLRK
jgi:hypothetical protein